MKKVCELQVKKWEEDMYRVEKTRIEGFNEDDQGSKFFGYSDDKEKTIEYMQNAIESTIKCYIKRDTKFKITMTLELED